MELNLISEIRKFLKKHRVKCIIFSIILVFLSFYLIKKGLWISGGRHILKVHSLREKITGYGNLSIIIFMVFYLAKSFFVILPSWPFIVVAGSIYGPLYGFLISMFCAILSASISFVIAKYAGSEFIQRILGKNASYMNHKLDNYGIRIIAVMRASFIVPFDVLSYAAGLTKIKFRDFLIGTFLGIVAEVFSLVYLGDNLISPRRGGIILSIVTIILVIGIPIIWSKYKKESKEDTIT